jgi:WD40 repeat protein
MLAVAVVLSTFLADAAGQAKDKKLFPDEKKAVDLYGDPLPENAMARLGTLRWRHLSGGRYRQVIDALAFSPDGRTLASLSAGNICLWETKSGAMLREFGSNGYGFDPWLRYATDGKTIIAGGEINLRPVVRHWNAIKGEDISSRKTDAKLPPRDLSPDGSVQAIKGDSLRLIDPVTRRELHRLPKCYEFAFSSDGKIACLIRNGVVLYDVASGKEVGRIAETMHYPMALAFSPDGKALAIGHSNGAIRLVNLKKPKLSPDTTGHRAPVKALAFHPGGKWLVSASADSLRIWDMNSGEEKRVLPGSVFGYTSMALSPNGNILAAAQERFIHLYDTATWLKTDTFAAEIAVEGLAFSPDGKTLLSNIGQIDLAKKKYRLASGIYPASAFSPDGGVLARGTSRGWGPYLFRADGSKINAFQIDLLGGPFVLSPLGKSIVTAKRDVREVVIYEQDTGKRRWSMWIPNPALALALSPDARLLAVGMNTDIWVWDSYVGRKLEFNGHFRPITTLAFSADGKTLASGSEDSTVLLWDLSDKVPARVPDNKKKPAVDLDKCWNDLADDWDIAVAFGAIQKLIQVPDQAVPLLRERLPRIAREYKKVKTDPPDPEYLRWVRGLEVVEFIGTPALKLVTELSQMSAAPILQTEARAALARMKKQQKK